MRQVLVLGNGAAGAEKQALALAAKLQTAIRSLDVSQPIGVAMARVPYTKAFVRIPPAAHVAAASLFQRHGLGYAPPLPTQHVPDIVVGCGRSTVALCAGLKRAHPSLFNIQIQHPRIDMAYFDAVLAPQHDFDAGAVLPSHVYATPGTITDVGPDVLDAWEGTAPWTQWPGAAVALLVGGSCRGYTLSIDRAKALVAQLQAQWSPTTSLFATFSRRTPSSVQAYLQQALPLAFPQLVLYDGKGENPYVGFLKHATYIVTTPDSVSMTTEALCTQKPVYVFDAELCTGKFLRFHGALPTQTWGAPLSAVKPPPFESLPADVRLAPLLVNDHTNVVAFDLPGHGRTSADVVGGYYYIDAAVITDVVATALTLLPPARFLLAGHSMGAHNALHVAARSDAVAGLALLNPMVCVQSRNQPTFEYWFGVVMRRCGSSPNFMTRWNRSIYFNKMRFSPSIPEMEFVAALYRMTTADYARVAADADTLRRQKFPVLVALTADDKVIEVEIGHELAAALGATHVTTFEKGGHNIVKTQVDGVAAALNEWASTVAETHSPQSTIVAA
ncbi:hypothetical protein SDRG_10456 [Saprolegnia diclina VS20]|uniref:AB hydrolase-1 domain-containing protein n=1 Tax=Saprolegnia diclina (strain VS20) TaxID=1156394 RepID=T0QEG1_SAPDV|nr:hypothetical protein SDRG_10456 [Saprolegnia diclina VS20]EQC31940.1 hypothetical protein SDRG_10456 [Saprolegnia diclina VS20]|eukprot:XP_008614668.1 hypothetical protein SDRG_10456 [Saprolegnia diclina VS20]